MHLRRLRSFLSAQPRKIPKNILNLSDSYLLEIFYYLDIKDQLNFARTCIRIERIFIEFSSVHNKIIKTKKSFLDEEALILIHLIGPNIVECYNANISAGFLRLPPENNSLKIIKISWDVESENLPNIIKFQKMEYVDIANRVSLDIILKILQKLPNLMKLSIRSSSEGYIIETYDFAALKEFTVNLSKINYAAFTKICMSMPNLWKLTIYHSLSTLHLRALITHCVNLEELFCELDSNSEQSLIADITKLKYVCIMNFEIEENLLSALAEKMAHQLKGLHLPNYLFSNDVTLLNRLENLEHLYLNFWERNPPNKAINLPKLEILFIESEQCLDELLLQTLRNSRNLKFIFYSRHILSSPEGILTEKFAIEADTFLYEEQNKRATLPICVMDVESSEITAFNHGATNIRFFGGFDNFPKEFSTKTLERFQKHCAEKQNFRFEKIKKQFELQAQVKRTPIPCIKY